MMVDGKEIVEFDYQELVKATEGFSPSRLIGKGSHGTVYKGILQDNKLVAIKRTSINGVDQAHNDNLKKLENEISVLSSLPESSHIVKFLGASHDLGERQNRVLVMEFLPNGSLYELLHVAATPPPWPKRLEVALQVARAVKFLHERNPPVIHRDIKPANILFDSNWDVKLADFGLAVSPGPDPFLPAGTVGYLDPLYITPEKLSTNTDVYSCGVVLLEIISGRKAIDITKAPAPVVEWAIPLIEKQRIVEICDPRTPLPADMLSTVRRLLSMAARCLSSDETLRPSILEIVTAIENSSIEPVRNSVFSSFLQSMIFIRPWQKEVPRCRASCAQKGDITGDASRGKVIIKEVLADMLP
ncbi:hypothetical protein SLEP1_g33997 [Rubroshorea leprosula]|uniref:Protein kinase domain-containing protein n=1 Tax=Rubroshorea leprosula TaxID=152421 RepID=A0AAV5KII2_9ROSI|nr:hypothetical protein SLEP1_g33997 [Rubroshorea leprosula]